MTIEDHPGRVEEVERPDRPDPSSSPDAEPTLDGAFAPDGVDLTLITWMLERSPEERLAAAQDLIDTAWALRGDEA